MNAHRTHFLKRTGLLAVFSVITLTGCSRLRPGESRPLPTAPLPATAARAVYDTVRNILDKAVSDTAFPGAFAVIGTRDGIVAQYGSGRLDALDETRPTDRTEWDLASLTKVIGTTSAMLQLVADGKVALDSQVVKYLPEWTAEGASRITVRQLLTHSSGLQAGRLFYKEASTADEAVAQLFATSPDTIPGVRYKYSDIGFLLLGQLVMRVSGTRLDQYLHKNVFGPLGMKDTRYLPPKSWRKRTAPTEQDPWRGRKIRGEVHDENAFRFGGVAGHAGLFSTARDLSRFARMYLNNGELDGVRVFDSATVKEFTSLQNASLSHRALGWEKPNGTNSAGHLLSPSAFGHTGFTGTSIWMDPDKNLFIILLTNRVNPTRQNSKIGAVRQELADGVVQALSNNR